VRWATAPDGREVTLSALAGVTQLSVADRRPRLRCAPDCTAVVVENLQAAESAAARFPDAAVLWVAGLPGDDELAALAGALVDAGRVLIIPDADAGGVAIAERICSVRPAAEVIDVGEQPHTPGQRLSEQSLRRLAAARNGPAGTLATACLQRGYRVEQEATTAAAITEAVNRRDGSARG
jgi:hypothetical protein